MQRRGLLKKKKKRSYERISNAKEAISSIVERVREIMQPAFLVFLKQETMCGKENK